MITMLNRKEVISTTHVEKYANARDDLKDAGIEFKLRSRAMHKSHVAAGKKIIPIGRNNGTEYIIYVKEQDYNRAINIIHNKEGWR